MSKSTIMLAAKFDTNKIDYPVEVTTKLDGVAADFYKEGTDWKVRSRQDKEILSVKHLLDLLNYYVPHAPNGMHLVGELTVIGVNSFKEASGIIRRKEVDPRIVLNIYDCYVEGEVLDYKIRMDDLDDLLGDLGTAMVEHDDIMYRAITKVPVNGVANNIDDLNQFVHSVEQLMATSPIAEGYVIRSLFGPSSHYKVGKRPNGFMKFKPKPTLDLRVISFEEATANKSMTFLDEDFVEGEGLRAVGRINVEYKGEIIGVGPGCLTHKERRTIWEGFVNNFQRHGVDLSDTGLIAEVEYMLDKSYDALRQPVFKRWRPDKTEPSYVA